MFKYLKTIIASVLALMILTSCASTQTSSSVTDTASSEQSTAETVSEWDFTTKTFSFGNCTYETYIDQPIRFDFTEIPYEEWLGYESPIDQYLYLFQAGTSFSIGDIAGLAVRYALENGKEYVTIPAVYGSENDAMYSCLNVSVLVPTVPSTPSGSEFKRNEDGSVQIHISDSALKSASKVDELLAAGQEIIDDMPADCETEREKAYYLYDWICQNVPYDSYHANNDIGRVNNAPQSAYGALINRRAVCEGIAAGVQLLYSMAGIECYKLTAASSDIHSWVGEDGSTMNDSAGHVWNCAKIDGEYWDFDATWDICKNYNDESDEITESEFPGEYIWFGVSRMSHNMSLEGEEPYFVPGTNDLFTENSAVLMTCDLAVPHYNSSSVLFSERGYADGDAMFNEALKTCLDEKGIAFVRFDDPDQLVQLCAVFANAEEMYEGTPNQELISFIYSDARLVVITAPEGS